MTKWVLEARDGGDGEDLRATTTWKDQDPTITSSSSSAASGDEWHTLEKRVRWHGGENGDEWITTFTRTITDTTTRLPKALPTDLHLPQCEKPVQLGWPNWSSNINGRTVNFCYPRLKHTCQRDAKVAYAKFRDFCLFWSEQGDKVARECDYMNNSPHSFCKFDDQCNMDSYVYRVPGPDRCCPFPWDGMDPEDYNTNDEILCSRYKAKDEDEYDYYTQNFAWYGIMDERFVWDNLTTEGYNWETGDRLWIT